MRRPPGRGHPLRHAAARPRRGNRATADRHPLAPVIAELRRLGRRENVAGRARFGIPDRSGYGVAMPELRRLARSLRPDHRLAARLWNEGSLDARCLAALIDDPERVGVAQMERWARQFDSWAVCDGCCQDLFRKTGHAWPMAFAWTHREEEYVKRAGFALFAVLAVHDDDAPDRFFLRALARVRAEATDPRRYVRKGVNWALRQIGKRNAALRLHAIRAARAVRRVDAPSARWIASDALRELTRRSARPGRSRLRGRAATSRPARPASPSQGRRPAGRSTPSSPTRRRGARR